MQSSARSPLRRAYGLLCFVACVGLLAGVAPSRAAAAEFRVEAGLGVAHGDHDLAYSRNLDAVGLSVERSEEHTSELQSLMRNSYAVFCLTKKTSSIQCPCHQNNNQ